MKNLFFITIAILLSYNITGQTRLWVADNSTEEIYRINDEGEWYTQIANPTNAKAIAMDHVARRVYYVEGDSGLLISTKFNGSDPDTISNIGTDVHDIALRPCFESIYYTVPITGEVRWINYDGSDSGVAHSTTGAPYSLYHDLNSRHLYWTDTLKNYILNDIPDYGFMQNSDTIVKSYTLLAVTSETQTNIAVEGNQVYWTEGNEGTLKRGNETFQYGGYGIFNIITLDDLGNIGDLTLNSRYKRFYWSDLTTLIIKSQCTCHRYTYEVRVSPNPTESRFEIKINSQLDFPNQISIQNDYGVFIQSLETNEVTTSIDCSDYPSGVYFITIVNGEERVVKKLVVL